MEAKGDTFEKGSPALIAKLTLVTSKSGCSSRFERPTTPYRLPSGPLQLFSYLSPLHGEGREGEYHIYGVV